MHRFHLVALLALIWHTVIVHSAALAHVSREQCQVSGKHCPKGTIVVSATEKHADFTTVQAAIESLPQDDSAHTVLILAGTYKEQVNITRAGPVTLLGQTSCPEDATKNKVTLTWAAANHDNTGKSVDNVFSSVLVVAPTLDSSLTGAGPSGFPVPEDTPFGNKDFRAYNIDFTNNWAEYSDGPAHALSFSRANGGFYYCGFYSYQDTVYVGKLGNAYFYKSILAGQTDFLYGFGTAWIQSSSVLLRGCGGGITAWKGTNTTFPNKYGVYIVDSDVRAANASIAPSIVGACALGRPWNELHRSIFARSYEDGSIQSNGYIDWIISGVGRYEKGVTLMAEYNDDGPGFNRTGRIESSVSTVLDRKGYEPFDEPRKVFQDPKGRFGDVSWIDWETARK
ncbi:Pectinesterase [Penicillium ucsense]|uniref:pectinesterase n=1 Tax=Penicillium ucsense TaxID=2839758 RepID=A0A8J8WJV3_9EURO|nr:Pectinesterase [Penicillium ucsense]KAF7737724.1 Pectinesterase [Penicillium ucsense]